MVGVIKRYIGGTIFLVITILVVIGMLVFAFNAFKDVGKDLEDDIYPMEYTDHVEKFSDKYEIDKALVYAVIKTESNFQENAESPVGAMGLMQIMPSTFEWLQTLTDGEITMDSESLLNPEINIDYGCRFLQFLLNRYTAEESAVAAYNAGFGAVDEWLINEDYSADGENLEHIPYPETANYVVKVKDAKEHYSKNI